jgi:hypothetical protein
LSAQSFPQFHSKIDSFQFFVSERLFLVILLSANPSILTDRAIELFTFTTEIGKFSGIQFAFLDLPSISGISI